MMEGEPANLVGPMVMRGRERDEGKVQSALLNLNEIVNSRYYYVEYSCK
jgi:hypothetical protein